MMGNPAENWDDGTLRTPVHWCAKSGGHWDIEGVCSSHWTDTVIFWDAEDLENIPEGLEEGTLAASNATHTKGYGHKPL